MTTRIANRAQRPSKADMPAGPGAGHAASRIA